MPQINIPLNDRQTCWLLSQLDQEISYLTKLDDLTPAEKEMLKAIQDLEKQVETTLERTK